MRNYLKIIAAFGLWLAASMPVKAADSTVSALTAASALGGTELLYVVQGGADRKGTPLQIAAYVYGLMSGDATASGTGTLTLATVNANVGTFGSATSCITTTQNAKGLTTAISAATCTPAIGSITGLGTGIATFLATPSSANLIAALTDETGTGSAVFGTAPTISSPTINTAATLGFITGSTQCLQVNTSGAISGTGSACGSGGGGTPGGSTTQIQYNNAGSFAGAAGLTTNGTDLTLGSSSLFQWSTDLILRRSAAATLALGAADAASPVAQNLKVQSVVTGTLNTGGQDFTITGSVGTGTGAGGKLIYQTSNTAGSGSTPNAAVTFLSIGPSAQIMGNGNASFQTDSTNATVGPSLNLILSGASKGIGFNTATGNMLIRMAGAGTNYLGIGALSNTTAALGYNSAGFGSALTPVLTWADSSGTVTMNIGQFVTKGFTVSGLPTGVTGGRAHVTDATACTGTPTGGGSTFCPVVFNGTAWIAEGSGGSGVTSITPGAGVVSSVTAAYSQSAVTSTGTLSSAQTVNAQTGTSYAIVDGDRSKLVTLTNSAAIAVTIAQAGASSSFVTGWYVDVSNKGAGTATITPTTSTINGSSTYVVLSGQTIRIVSDGTNYQVQGGGSGSVTISNQTGTNYAFVASDNGKVVYLSNASAQTPTMPVATTVGAGWFVTACNIGSQTQTITPTTSTIGGASTLILPPGSAAQPVCNTIVSDGTNYTLVPSSGKVFSGTATLGTSAIASAACATVVTVSAPGVLTTDVVLAGFNGDPTAITGYVPATAGMLTIISYPTANNVNFKVCNNTTSSITPGAITLNARVLR